MLYLDDIRVSFPAGTADIKSNPTFNVFPNPASDKITVSGLPVNTEIQITDLTGKLLSTMRALKNATMIDVSSLPKGVYLLRSAFGVKKIVKI